MKVHNPITVYKHNKVAGAYNRTFVPSKYPYLVGGATGALVGAGLAASFKVGHAEATSGLFKIGGHPAGGYINRRSTRAVAGAFGGAAGGLLAAKSRENFSKRMREVTLEKQGHRQPYKRYVDWG